MKYSRMLLVTLTFGLSSAFAADAPQKPAAAKPHPAIQDCHPGYGMGGYGMGHGMGGYGMGGYGRGMMGMGLGPRTAMVWSLNLSSEQRAKVGKLIEKLKHDNWAVMGTIMDDAGVLRDLYHEDRRDSVAIDQTYKKIFDSKRKMIKSALDTENEIEDLLTPEQLSQLKDRLHQAPPPYPGQY